MLPLGTGSVLSGLSLWAHGPEAQGQGSCVLIW